MRVHSRVAAAAIAAAALTLLAGCGTTPPSPEGPIALTIRLESIPGSWNPVADGAKHYQPAIQAVYEPLLRETSAGEFEPWLAESYETSDDGLTMEVKLRDGVTFSDGSPLTAEVVKGYFDLYIPSVKGVELATTYGLEVEVVDDLALRLTTTRPMRSQFLLELQFAVIAPESVVASGDDALAPDDAVGTGPYLVDEVIPDASVSFVRNPDYWNEDAVVFDSITAIVYDDDVAAINALKSGQLNAAYIDDLALANGATQEDADLRLNTGDGGLAPALFFIDRVGDVDPSLPDARTREAIRDVRVRQAINMAFDRAGINAALNFGMGRESSQQFIPGDAVYVEGGDERYPFDLEQARELLAEAGYADGFTLTFGSVPGFTDAYEPALEQALAELNIEVVYDTVQLADFATLFTDKWPNAYYPVAAYPLATGDVGLDWIARYLGGYKEPEAQELYDRFVFGDAEESAAAAVELGEYMLENAWYAPFSAPPSPILTRDGVVVDYGLISPDGLNRNVPLWAFVVAD